MTNENRIDSIAQSAYNAGLKIVEGQQKHQSTPPRQKTAPRTPPDSETLAILEKWKSETGNETTAPRPLSTREATAMLAKEQAQAAVTSGPVDTNGTVPAGRNAPQRQPGLRFVAIVIDGQVVEGMTATERLVAALTSGPEVIDVTENAWLPEIGDYYQDGAFLFNPSGGMNK